MQLTKLILPILAFAIVSVSTTLTATRVETSAKSLRHIQLDDSCGAFCNDICHEAGYPFYVCTEEYVFHSTVWNHTEIGETKFI